MKTALVYGYYGKDNAGDDAMLQVIADQFRKMKIRTIAASFNPRLTKKCFGIKSVGNKSDFSRLKYDFFVLGGGTQIQDYRVKGFENLVKTFLKAKKPGVKTCLLGIGVGKLKKKKGKALARKLCENSDLIVVRDNESRKELKKAGVKKNIFVCTDLTFSQAKKSKRAKKNAIGFCPIPYYEIFEKAPAKDKMLAKKLGQAIEIVAEKTNAKIVLVPFFKKYDPPFIREILKHVKSRKVRAMKYRPLGIGLAKTFEKFDIIVGMRFHSLVFSAVLGKPFVAIALTPKIKNLVKKFAWKQFAVYKGFSSGALAEKTIALYNSKEKQAGKISARQKALKKKSVYAFELFRKRLL